MNKTRLVPCAALLAGSPSTVLGAGPAPSESRHLADVKIPAYDRANPERCLITPTNNGREGGRQ